MTRGGRRLRKTIQRKISAGETELEETVYLGAYQRRRIIRVQNGTSQIILERATICRSWTICVTAKPRPAAMRHPTVTPTAATR